jgi:ribosomal protein L37AE/L43A
MARYLFDRIKEPMNKEILKLNSKEELEKKGELISKYFCPKCKNPAQKKIIGVYKCPNFSCRSEVKSLKSNRKKMLCPSCNDVMKKVNTQEIIYCENCKTNSAIIDAQESNFLIKNDNLQFKEKFSTKSAEDSVDFVLVAPRHLFRAPYSLHEKTALASVVLKKEEIEDFKPSNAEPLKIKELRPFIPENVIQGEAEMLLFEAIDNYKSEVVIPKKYEGNSIDLKGLTITQEMFPPVIKRILKGIKGDGRKRALNILLTFYNSLEFPQDYIIEKVNEWNSKNKVPLKTGYVNSQIDWSNKNKRLPPNYDKPVYKEFGELDKIETQIKNPINYTIKEALRASKQL